MEEIIIRCKNCTFQFALIHGNIIEISKDKSNLIVQCPICVSENRIVLIQEYINEYRTKLEVQEKLNEPRILPHKIEREMGEYFGSYFTNFVLIPEEINVFRDKIILNYAIYRGTLWKEDQKPLQGDYRLSAERVLMNYRLFAQDIEEFYIDTITNEPIDTINLPNAELIKLYIRKTYLTNRSFILDGQLP